MTVAEATAEIAEHLGCVPGRPLLRIDRVHRTAAGRVVEPAISHFLPEHYSYRVRQRRTYAWRKDARPEMRRSTSSALL
ncbi:UTRA domain-containing protein [Streptomyces sp. NPDC092369]|uniref:UTRA domain-containing protein n=1 Tax=Streptomyces sp. NPDC092369 TaxID=3366015 RepID=UPI0038005D85